MIDISNRSIQDILAHAGFGDTAPSAGGCREDTPLILADGSAKRADEIKKGEKLLCPEEECGYVTVTGITAGEESVYRISPVWGNDIFVTADFLCKSISKDAVRADGIDKTQLFPPSQLHFIREDLRFLDMSEGLTAAPGILGSVLSDDRLLSRHLKRTSVGATLLSCGVTTDHVFIPEVYKRADIDTRCRLLAGIYNFSGYFKGGQYHYETSHKELAEDIVFVADSVGAYAKINRKSFSAQTDVILGGDLKVLGLKDEHVPSPVINTVTSVPEGSAKCFRFQFEGTGRDTVRLPIIGYC